MKKPLSILVITSMLFIVACGGDTENESNNNEATTEETTEEVAEEEVVEEAEEASIVGEWQLSDMDMGIEIPAGQEEAFAASIKEAVESTKYTFNEDGTMVMVNQLGTQNGTYTVDGNMLNASTEGKDESIEIGELTANKLVLLIKEEGMNGSMTFER